MTMLRSVTSRLVLSYCILLCLLGGIFLSFTVLSFQHYTRETIGDNLAARTLEVWNTTQGVLDQPQRLRDVIARRFAPESQDRFIRIRIGNRVVYRSGDPAEHDFFASAIPLIAAAPRPQALFRDGMLIYTQAFSDSAGRLVTIDSGQSYAFAHAVQDRLASSLFVGLPVLLLLAAFAGYLLMRRALTPVEIMINAAEAFSFNDSNKRLPLLGTEPRIEALGHALNRMLDRLDGAYSHVSRFSADAAHELRTPLTIIRGELELAMRGTSAPDEIESALTNALEEMTRLSGIVDSLITLSRMDSMWGKRTHSAINLGHLVAEVIDQMELLAIEKRITLLEGGIQQAVIVAGDRDRLKQVVVNLVDNAIKYTPMGGRVRLDIGLQGENAVLTVEDTGIGIDPSQHDKIFERFYRVSTNRGEIGAGLGLAIVKSICHAHGGNIGIRSVLGGGSCFRVELPLANGADEASENKLAAAKSAAARI